MNARMYWRLAALVLLMGVSGCGNSRLVKVTGKLTYKGEPIRSTLVTFLPDDGGRKSHGVTDDNGYFTLRYSKTASGVTRGGHVVFLKYEVSADEELHKVPTRATPEQKAVIAQHHDPARSGLHYDVTQDGQFIEIKLE